MRRPHEEGAVAIITAIILTVLLLLAAFLVDMGATRADARTDQLLADSAVMAAALTDGTAENQCIAAANTYAANVGVATVDTSPCSVLASLDPGCNGSTPSTTTDPITIGDFTMVVTFPVDNDDDAMEVNGQIAGSRDETRCERIKVSIARTRNFNFAGAAGVSTSGGSVNDAVAIRTTPPQPQDFASLIVLETEACNALVGDGGAHVEVRDGAPWDHDNDPGTPDVTPPGIISVDSTADGGSGSDECKATRTVIDAPSSGCIEASGHIKSYGLQAGDPTHVYDPSDIQVDPCIANTGMYPIPEPGDVIGRKLVDWRFNCLASYPSASGDDMRYPAVQHNVVGLNHGPCPDVATRPPFMNELYDRLDGGDLVVNHQFTAVGPAGGDCPNIVYDGLTDELTLGAAPPILITEPRLWIRCQVDSPSTSVVDITDVEYVVFDQPFDKAPTLLRIHGSAGVGAVAYFRKGGFTFDGGGRQIDLQDTFVYLDEPPRIKVTSTVDVTWLSLELSDAEARVGMHSTCQPYSVASTDGDPLTVPADLPPPGCFAPLALWSNVVTTGASTEHVLTGSGAVTVRGSFFTPNAVSRIGGSGASDFTRSQFFSNVLNVHGGGAIVLIPDPNTNIPTDPPEPALIR